LKASQQQVGRREKVELSLSARSAGRPVSSANCSVSVFLADSLQGLESGDIRSYLWLESDLKGLIESPSYYLDNAGAEAGEAADNLMLTQGWRRFRWKEVLEDPKRSPEFLPEFDGHLVHARILSRRSGMPAADVVTYLSIPGSRFALHAAQSNEKGIVRFDVQRFYGNAEMILQTNSGSDSLLRIEMLNPFSERYSTWQGAPFELPATWADQLVFRSRNAQVHNEFVASKRQPFVSPVFPDTTAFFGVPDNKYFLDEYTRFITMEEVMREYVKEVHVRKQKDHFHFDVQNIPYQQFFDNDPLVLLDGLPVFDINRIMAMDPL
jgi:hypothetical protein